MYELMTYEQLAHYVEVIANALEEGTELDYRVYSKALTVYWRILMDSIADGTSDCLFAVPMIGNKDGKWYLPEGGGTCVMVSRVEA